MQACYRKVRLNVYLSLSDDNKKDAEEIKKALRAEFEPARRDREVALQKLANRMMLKGESPYTYAYSLMELTKLAYATLPADSRDVIARDHFMKGQSRDMQVALKSLPQFSTKPVTELAKEVVRFQTAGVSTNDFIPVKSEVDSIEVKLQNTSADSTMIDSVVDKVVAKLSDMHSVQASNSLNYIRGKGQRGRRGYSRGANAFTPNNRGNTYQTNYYRGANEFTSNYRGNNYQTKRTDRGNPSRNSFNCRSCKSPAHGYSKCPTRFCQACGGRGHDAWNQSCPNY